MKMLLGRFLKSPRPALAPWMPVCNVNLTLSGKQRVMAVDDSMFSCSKGCELSSEMREKGPKIQTVARLASLLCNSLRSGQVKSRRREGPLRPIR